MSEHISVSFRPATDKGGASMVLSSYSDQGAEMCRKITDAFHDKGLLFNEENFDLVTKQLGY